MLASKTHLFDRPRDGLSFAPFEHRLSLIAEENKRVAQKRRWAPVFLTPHPNTIYKKVYTSVSTGDNFTRISFCLFVLPKKERSDEVT